VVGSEKKICVLVLDYARGVSHANTNNASLQKEKSAK
jgi:hypothetical protein